MSRDKHTSDGGSTAYYDLPPNCKDLQDLVEYRNMNFSIGNIFKACYRLGRKTGQDDLYDINKIIYFAEREKIRILRSNSTAWIRNQGCMPKQEFRSIEIKLRNEYTRIVQFQEANYLRWSLDNNAMDIIEYRVLE